MGTVGGDSGDGRDSLRGWESNELLQQNGSSARVIKIYLPPVTVLTVPDRGVDGGSRVGKRPGALNGKHLAKFRTAQLLRTVPRRDRERRG